MGADVSEPGFTRDKNALCVIPVDEDKDKNYLREPGQEKEITQEMRQEGFDNWETTDDHGMQIFGIAKDKNGKEYFMVKNSWNTTAGNNGIWYASDAYVALKTINILVHSSTTDIDAVACCISFFRTTAENIVNFGIVAIDVDAVACCISRIGHTAINIFHNSYVAYIDAVV